VAREKSIEKFNEDVRANDGYRYTSNAKPSSTMANARISREVAQLVDLRGKRVIDVGCGDGIYTEEFLAMGAAYVLGVDAAADAIALASGRPAVGPRLAFRVAAVDQLSSIGEQFDVAVVRGLLHHLYDAEPAAAAICAIADEVVVIEPNGYNPVLKVIEKVSRYHVEHEEKSYPPRRLDRWFESQGAVVEDSRFIGLVPYFCPDGIARGLKKLEPLVERTPLIRAISCGQYVQRISTTRSHA
jgi:SAM-dependent methyltransferase